MLTQNTDFTNPHLNKVVHTLIEIQTDTVIRLADDNQDFSFGGHTFNKFPFQLQGITESSKGEIPKITIQISNITNLIIQILEEGIDNTPVIIRVVREGETTADLEYNFIANSVSYDEEWISLDLTAPANYTKSYPSTKYTNCCPFVFKGWRCRYSGSTTSCNKTMKQCKQLGNFARFGGFYAS